MRGNSYPSTPRKKIFKIKMSVDAILTHFETTCASEILLIVQAFHVAVFKRVFRTPTLKNEQLFQPLHRSHRAMASKLTVTKSNNPF